MSDAAIWVEGFSTGYRIGPRERYEALRDIITDAFVAPFRRLRENSQSAMFFSLPSAFWSFAIRNSTFAIRNRTVLRPPSPVNGQSSAFRNLHSAFERATSHAGDIELLAQRPPLPRVIELLAPRPPLHTACRSI